MTKIDKIISTQVRCQWEARTRGTIGFSQSTSNLRHFLMMEEKTRWIHHRG
ncbi:hypothetical protein NC651_005630 [Populus alba x Populus x berolinensis]|nr:hypothetical protein NC651_005630 [Populus alba x Populus x berolinensis]